jgi:hypothetical protein
MTRDDTIDLLAVLKAAYPNFYRGMTVKEANGVVDLWWEMFKDQPAPVVGMAVKALIATDTKGFPPHIGAVKEAISKLMQPNEMTPQEAWALVNAATRRSTYYAQEEFDKLPQVVQRIVGTPMQLKEWAAMDSDTLQSVIASNFQRSYKVKAEKEREFLALPAEIRQMSEQLAAGMAIPALPGSTEDEPEKSRDYWIEKVAEI